MRIRYPFAGAFVALILLAAYAGLTRLSISAVNDKALHFIAFFCLTITLYWAADIPRRLLIKIVLIAMLSLSVASEVLQAALPIDRAFDPVDIGANVVGSLLALTLCGWYHKRMLDRKRRKKLQGYGHVSNNEGEDLEMGGGLDDGQETRVVAEGEEDDGADAWDDIGGENSGGGEENTSNGPHKVAETAK